MNEFRTCEGSRRPARSGQAVASRDFRRCSPAFMTGMIGVGLLAALALFGCDKGPAQKAGERIDSITDQDKIIGKGPAEKAGKDLDKAADKLTK
jgi:hypothetical protein